MIKRKIPEWMIDYRIIEAEIKQREMERNRFWMRDISQTHRKIQ